MLCGVYRLIWRDKVEYRREEAIGSLLRLNTCIYVKSIANHFLIVLELCTLKKLGLLCGSLVTLNLVLCDESMK